MEAVAEADAVLVCVPSTVDAQGARHEALARACAAVVSYAHAGQTIVLTSATYVGSTRELLVEPLPSAGCAAGEDVFVAFSPERFDPAAGGREQLGATRVVGAVTETCFAHAAELLPLHVRRAAPRVLAGGRGDGEAVRERLPRGERGARVSRWPTPAACTRSTRSRSPTRRRPRAGFMAHYPSAGAGGHCVGVDPHYMLHSLRERGRPRG